MILHNVWQTILYLFACKEAKQRKDWKKMEHTTSNSIFAVNNVSTETDFFNDLYSDSSLKHLLHIFCNYRIFFSYFLFRNKIFHLKFFNIRTKLHTNLCLKNEAMGRSIVLPIERPNVSIKYLNFSKKNL